MSRYFLVNPNIEVQDKGLLNKIRIEKEEGYNGTFQNIKARNQNQLLEEDDLIHVEGRVVVKIDIDGKDSWTFENGMKIEYKRRFNNFNQREASPVNAIVISGEGITKGAEILIHPNAIHDSNRIFDYKDSNDTIRYYAIHNDMCFAWHDGSEWKPLPPFSFALNVYEPYKGLIQGLPPKQLKDTLFVLDGELKDKVVKTIPFSSYTIVFQDKTNREGNIIRFRPFGCKKTNREEEAIAILHNETELVLSGGLLIGITDKDANNIQVKFANKRP